AVLWRQSALPSIFFLSLHDALPIFPSDLLGAHGACVFGDLGTIWSAAAWCALRASPRPPAPHVIHGCTRWTWAASSTSCLAGGRSEEHTSQLQSRFDLVCRLLLDKQ